MQADPWPLKDIFIRSDQYNFVRDGIPALMMMDGAAPGSPEEKLLMEWLHDRYHAPSDDTNQPVDLAAGKFEDIVRDLTVKVADGPQKPEGKSTSFLSGLRSHSIRGSSGHSYFEQGTLRSGLLQSKNLWPATICRNAS